MRRAISVILAAVLVTTPLKLVLAQAAEQEAVSVHQTASDSTGHRLIGVPPVTDNTSRLWEPLASEDALAGIFAYDDSQTRVPRVPKAVVVVVVILLLLFIIVAIACDPEGKIGSPC